MGREAVSDVNQAFNIFLDTISSAFGGIIFIALLVVIQLQMTGGQSAAQAGKEKQAGVERQIRELRDQIDIANRLRQAQIDQIRALGPVADNELVRQYTEAMERLKKLQDSSQAAIAQSSKSQQLAAQLKRQLEQLDEQFRKLVARKDQDLKAGKVPANAPPLAGVSQKRQVAVLISGGRLAFYLKYDEKAQATAENTEEVVIEEVGGQKMVRPRADRGLAIHRAADMSDSLGKVFNIFTPAPTAQNHAKESECHAISLVVWPDSYREAEVVRDYLISKGFEYGLLLLTANSAVKVSKDPTVIQTFGHKPADAR